MNSDTTRKDRPARVYCDFNDRLGPAIYGLRVLGTVEDIKRQQLRLTAGLPLILYDYDGFDDGIPAWIVADAVVAADPDHGFVADVDPDSFRWVPRRGDPQSDLSTLGRFRVEQTFEIMNRGGALAGTIIEGELRVGQAAAVRDSRGSTVVLEISAVEFADNLATGESRIALLFAGAPPANRLGALAPVGATLDFASK